MSPIFYDVIIVGGGPAGATVGKHLALAGKKVLLLQKDLSFKKPCGGGLRIDAFEEFSIDKDQIEHVVSEIVIESKHRRLHYDISKTPLAIVNRVHFDQSLRADAVKAGVTLLEARVVNVSISGRGVQVEAEEKRGTTVLYKARYLVAADGVHSQVRKVLRKEAVPSHMTHYSDVMSLKTECCHFYFGTAFSKGAYAWRFPYGEGSDIGVVSSFNKKKNIFSFFDVLGLAHTQKIRGYKIPVWHRPLFYEKQVYYVGDAAGQVLPFTYEGIYYAMKSAKILSGVITENLPPEYYERRWNRHFKKKFSILSRLEKLFLHSEFMVYLMMRTLEKPSVQKKVLLLWMDQYDVKINRHFWVQIIKNMFSKHR